MKKIWKGLVAALLVLTMCFSFVGCGSSDKIIVQTNAFFAPFEYYQGQKIVGVDVDIMNLVGEELGKDVEFVNGDFGIIIDVINEGKKADVGAAGITITEARQQKVDFSKPYYTSVQYVIWKETDTSFATQKAADNATDIILWSDLAGKKIGVQANTTGDIYVNIEIDGDGPDYPGELNGTSAECKPFDDAQIATDAIGSQVDCVVVDELPAQFIVGKNAGLKCAPLYYDAETATEEQYAMCVTPGNDELLNAINKVLDSLLNDVKDGKNAIERMVAQHLGLND
ncbi:MAG: transporter substrate-binding domain-containing protein [Clostridia bacterium]|nr:transporter substrate-binding domain-containing protein [Clostridia bacterium]